MWLAIWLYDWCLSWFLCKSENNERKKRAHALAFNKKLIYYEKCLFCSVQNSFLQRIRWKKSEATSPPRLYHLIRQLLELIDHWMVYSALGINRMRLFRTAWDIIRFPAAITALIRPPFCCRLFGEWTDHGRFFLVFQNSDLRQARSPEHVFLRWRVPEASLHTAHGQNALQICQKERLRRIRTYSCRSVSA